MSGIPAGVELVGSVKTCAVASVMAASGDTGRAGVAATVCGVSVSSATESGVGVRAGGTAALCSTSELRVNIDSVGELGVIAGAGTGVLFSAETDSGGDVHI